jgi:hypothetical protein
MTRLDEPRKHSRSKPATRRASEPLGHRWRRPRWQWLAALAAVGLAGLGIVIYAATNRTGSTTGSNPSTASPYVSGPVTVHHHALRVTPEQAFASVRVPPRLAAALRKWDAGPGGTLLTNVSGDLGDAAQSFGVRQFGPMLRACSSLATAVTTATTGPPIPNAAMQASYSQALDTLAAAAADCRAGISQYPTEDEGLQTRENPTILHQAESELAVGATDLSRATVDINAVRLRAARK